LSSLKLKSKISKGVNVEMRPVTQHGLTGMQFNRKKVDRTNKDYNYYHNLLKRKIKELHIESKNIQLEINKIETGN